MKKMLQNFTKRMIAKRANISERDIYRISNYTMFPSDRMAKMLAATLHVSVIDLWPPVVFDRVEQYRNQQQSIGELYGLILPQAKRRLVFNNLMQHFGTEWTQRYNLVADGLAIPNKQEYMVIRKFYTPAQQATLSSLVERTDFIYNVKVTPEEKAARSLKLHTIINDECAEQSISFNTWCENAHLDPVEVGQWIMGVADPNLVQERLFLKALGFDIEKLPQTSYLWNRKA